MLASVGIGLPFRELMALVCSGAVLVIAYKFRPALASACEHMTGVSHLWQTAVLLGIALRLGLWLLTGQEVQVNDGLHYFTLANRLYLGQSYELDGYAFWPPGIPLIYSLFMHLVGQVSWIAVPVNCAFFLLAAVSIRSLCRRLGLHQGAAGLTVGLLAVWPALVFPITQISKETVLIGLLPAILALLVSRSLWTSVPAGLLTGAAILTQPSLMLVPVLLATTLYTRRLPLRMLVARMALLFVGILIVVSPWSYRNYLVFGEFVPVSTNAGLVLHAGNQPEMVKSLGEVGGFLQPPMPSTPMKHDLALSRWHKDEALRFISSNKMDFAKLVWNRLVITMGDDSDSAYRSLRLTRKVPGNVYLLTKAVSNLFWLMLTAMLAASCYASSKESAKQGPCSLAVFAAGATLYLMAVHGLAEGGARHHMAWSWLYALLLVAGLVRSAAPTDGHRRA